MVRKDIIHEFPLQFRIGKQKKIKVHTKKKEAAFALLWEEGHKSGLGLTECNHLGITVKNNCFMKLLSHFRTLLEIQHADEIVQMFLKVK